MTVKKKNTPSAYIAKEICKSLLRDCLLIMCFPYAYLMRFLRSCPKVHVRFHTFTLMSSDMEAGILFQAPPL